MEASAAEDEGPPEWFVQYQQAVDQRLDQLVQTVTQREAQLTDLTASHTKVQEEITTAQAENQALKLQRSKSRTTTAKPPAAGRAARQPADQRPSTSRTTRTNAPSPRTNSARAPVSPAARTPATARGVRSSPEAARIKPKPASSRSRPAGSKIGGCRGRI